MQTTYMDSTPILRVSEMAESLVASEIIMLSQAVKARMAEGEHIYNFTIGDFNPDIFPIPTELKNHIIAAYKNNHTNYPMANGMPELRQAVSRYLHTRGGLEYHEDQVLVSCGARPIIHAAYQTLVDPGDTVIFPVPSWNNNHYCHLKDAKSVIVETKPENNFMPTAEDIKPHLSEAVLIALCSPQNPTGTAFGRTQLMEICDLILDENRKRGDMNKPVYLLYDQIYWMLTHGDTVHHDPVNLVPEMKNYTIYVDGISKAFAATGVRVGWGFGPQKIIDKMKAVNTHIGAWSPKAEQLAIANYLGEDDNVDEYIDKMRANIGKRLDGFYKGFQELKEEGFKVDAIAPQAAMYLTIRLDLHNMHKPDGEKLGSTAEVTQYLLDEAKIAMVPFNYFGAGKNSPWYRLSVGTTSMSDIDGFFSNLKRALEQLT